ncbi:hypothetical protein B0I35DRAFT_406387 [Stachybotrys elegans]|uniref:Uncharacterized protein n=1 Tax=Stachybotrys elegans TaxID=80388 RepID=A0A8K0SY35_9HYPO|nr:hypothetical protein B0I35DRAFT_406387 [Stachybotrys elegans]
MARLLLSVLAAGGAAAQQITAFPALPEGIVNAPLNPNDPEFSICTSLDEVLVSCVNELGGSDAATADPTGLFECACCGGGSPISESFSTCATYIFDEEPSMTSEASLYANIYSVCSGLGVFCSASATATATAAPSLTSSSITVTAAPESTTESALDSLSISITATGTIDSIPTECQSMVGLFTSCVAEIDGFSDLPYGEQASCYCCRTTRGVVTWTDELDEYAQTCRDWARTGEPDTIFPVASTFAVFCDNFSDVCEGSSPATETAEQSPSNTDTPNPTEEEDNRVTVTVTPDAAAGLIPSVYMAGVMVVVAVAAIL